MLIEAGANVNSYTDHGISAIIESIGKGYEEYVNLLLEAGADVKATSQKGYDARAQELYIRITR